MRDVCLDQDTWDDVSTIEQEESIDYSLSRVDYDLISMNKRYNDDC
jgi:hypothetical protein